MILVVPISPEVPKRLRSNKWPGIIMAAFLVLGFVKTREILKADLDFVATLPGVSDSNYDQTIPSEVESLLRERPLLDIAPARGDWDLKRLLLANFVHGSVSHLALNVLCAFAGARLCATFLPLATILSIFTMGGSLGLFLSLMFSGIQSNYIPHIGASAGIFALMGTYYVYNFRYRTRYFFWFPTRNRYFLSLPTASFFFVDVILVELALSTAQLLPNQWDNIDHFAHVLGFISGSSIAYLFRTIQKWPPYIHTRAEYFVHLLIAHRSHNDLRLNDLITLLNLNGFNDVLKCWVIDNRKDELASASTETLSSYFRFISPTFIRYHVEYTAKAIEIVIGAGQRLPRKWLSRLPYDLLVQIAYKMSTTPKRRTLLIKFFYNYLDANHEKYQLTLRVKTLVEHLEAVDESTQPRSSRQVN